jgi:hypothetical protein
VPRVQEQHLDVEPVAQQRGDDLPQVGHRLAAARVDRHCDPLVALLEQRGDHLPEELRRQVVDAEEALVLQDVDRDRLARAGDAGDQDDAHPFQSFEAASIAAR